MSNNSFRVLIADDRCDKCKAPARIALEFKSGELMFCGSCLTNMSDSLKRINPFIIGVDNSLLEVMK